MLLTASQRNAAATCVFAFQELICSLSAQASNSPQAGCTYRIQSKYPFPALARRSCPCLAWRAHRRGRSLACCLPWTGPGRDQLHFSRRRLPCLRQNSVCTGLHGAGSAKRRDERASAQFPGPAGERTWCQSSQAGEGVGPFQPRLQIPANVRWHPRLYSQSVPHSNHEKEGEQHQDDFHVMLSYTSLKCVGLSLELLDYCSQRVIVPCHDDRRVRARVGLYQYLAKQSKM